MVHGLIVALLGAIALWVFLVVGLVVAGVGYMFVRQGLDALKKENLAPRQTIETLKEDAEWAKQQMK